MTFIDIESILAPFDKSALGRT